MFHLDSDLRQGLIFGVSSGVITTSGLLAGLVQTPVSPIILIVTIVSLAISDGISESYGLFISKKVGFTQAETSSLIITASARNTPLMLAISVGVFPSETVIQLILILGMLIEFPHLILLSFLLCK